MEDIGPVDILIYAVAGLVIGILARIILPGRQKMSLVATLIVGAIAAVLGGLLWNQVFKDNEGVAWIGSIIVAVVLVFLYERLVGRRGPRA
jgi:uncharacterized membrane protein YeaQ/YmgE (transglycosylase-associated protein family)